MVDKTISGPKEVRTRSGLRVATTPVKGIAKTCGGTFELESLERRALFSLAIENGILVVHADRLLKSDTIRTVNLAISPTGQSLLVAENTRGVGGLWDEWTVDVRSIRGIRVEGGAGPDYISARSFSRLPSGETAMYDLGLPVTLLGNGGNDVLIGGAVDDVIVGGEGDDRIFGGLGADTLQGERGIDLDGWGEEVDFATGWTDGLRSQYFQRKFNARTFGPVSGSTHKADPLRLDAGDVLLAPGAIPDSSLSQPKEFAAVFALFVVTPLGWTADPSAFRHENLDPIEERDFYRNPSPVDGLMPDPDWPGSFLPDSRSQAMVVVTPGSTDAEAAPVMAITLAKPVAPSAPPPLAVGATNWPFADSTERWLEQ